MNTAPSSPAQQQQNPCITYHQQPTSISAPAGNPAVSGVRPLWVTPTEVDMLIGLTLTNAITPCGCGSNSGSGNGNDDALLKKLVLLWRQFHRADP